MANSSLHAAKDAKNDEFYTRYEDIQAELNHYREQFKGKTVYCNCDDPGHSAFSQFFMLNFDYFGLKKLICTRYKNSNLFWKYEDGPSRISYKLEITGKDDCKKTLFEGNGDFRSPECVELLKEADVICTNPPFSLFREYIGQLIKYEKKFLIIGNKNALTYKEVFPLIKDNKVWLGYTSPKDFIGTDGRVSGKMAGLTRWFTNLDITKRHEKMILYEKYSKEKYPNFDNYDAINVEKTVEIPCDYDGVMGVPISFLDKYNPEQFEIIGLSKTPVGTHLRKKVYSRQEQIGKDGKKMSDVTKLNDGGAIEIEKPIIGKICYKVNGKYYQAIYPRILIKRKDIGNENN